MGIERCGFCEEFAYPHHRCPPKWEVRAVDDNAPDEWKAVFAPDAEGAAELFVERRERNECEYRAANGGTVAVIVRGPEGEQSFEVTGECVAEYHAREVVRG